MSSLASLVLAGGPIKRNDPDGDDVLVLQMALSAAGYRVGQDRHFGERTEMVVRQFQEQHDLKADGIVGMLTAQRLDAPHATLISTARPMFSPALNGFPHDDTASLKAFYGDPESGHDAWRARNVVTVPCPWTLFYAGKLWAHPVPLHTKCAAAFAAAWVVIWEAAGKDNNSPVLEHLHAYSGSGNLRAVRGSSRLSTHAFWAAIDYDAEHLPLGKKVAAAAMPQVVVDAFEAQHIVWGGRFIGRPDAMHFQAAHE